VQLAGGFFSVQEDSVTTEQEREEFEKWWDSTYRGWSNKFVAEAAWQAARVSAVEESKQLRGIIVRNCDPFDMTLEDKQIVDQILREEGIL
jgi:hypothetical protein